MFQENLNAGFNYPSPELLAFTRRRLALFLALQQHPDVMRFVAEDRPVAAIREAFDSRLTPRTPGSAHWLCLVVRDAASVAPLGVTGYIHREEDCAEVGFLFAPEAQGKGYGFESLKALCDYAFHQGGIRRLTATVTAGNIASRRLLEKPAFARRANYARAITLRDVGIMTGYLVYCGRNI